MQLDLLVCVERTVSCALLNPIQYEHTRLMRAEVWDGLWAGMTVRKGREWISEILENQHGLEKHVFAVLFTGS